jgi:hypothetical protein
MLASYAGTEFEAELNELFSAALAPAASTDADAAVTALSTGPLSGLDITMESPIIEALANDDVTLNVEQLSASIQSKIDQLGRDDALELIQIQSLTADIREASQLASNLVASASQAANTIVGNIGR